MTYLIKRSAIRPEMQGAWDGPVWGEAEILEVAQFRPESGDHRPQTRAKLLYADEAVYGIFRVKDRYVRCVCTEYQDPVWRDSCVEFFVQPKMDKGYLNFEFNCGGAMLVRYILDCARDQDGELADYVNLSAEDGESVRRFHSMPCVVEPEVAEPADWVLEFAIPLKLLEKYVGPLGNVSGQEWRANFYKCGDQTSHPHWASWSPVSALNFHLPECFGTIKFQA